MTQKELRAFTAQNPGFDLLSFDFHDKQAVAGLRLGDTSADSTLTRLRTRQRVLRLTGSDQLTAKLVAAGLHSAHQIGAMSQARFLREHGDLFADADECRQVHAKAVATRGKAQQVWANVADIVASRHYRATRFYNARDDLADYFQQIPSYSELFGGLDYLACPHCRSIFSPAAYFVDLMRITDEYVTYPNTNKASDNIPDGLKLEDRRPDLFDLPLTCASVDTQVPYLEIVNKVLQAKLHDELHADVFPALALASYPFNLPFQLPLTAVRANLTALKTSLAQVYGTMSGPVTAGLARQGGANAIVLAESASDRDGEYLSLEITLTAGPGTGQTRRIASYEGATRRATVSPGWTTEPTEQTRYEISDTVDLAREQLGLSAEQYQLLTTQATGPADIARMWGYRDLAGVLPAFAGGAGFITISAGSKAVAGDDDTHFDTELAVGDQLWCGEEIRAVAAITGPSSLTVDQAWGADRPDASYQVARWRAGPGHITVHEDRTQVTGDADAHLDQLTVGDQLQCAGVIRTVVLIRSATMLVVDSPFGVAAENAGYTVNPVAGLTRLTTFLRRTGLTRTDVDALFRQGTSEREFRAGVTQRFFINATDEDLPALHLVTDLGDPANSFERVVGLSLRRLDRLSRFIRLQRMLGWTCADTQWLFDSAGATEIDAQVIEALAATSALTASTAQPVDVVTSFWHELKTSGRGDEATPADLFDRVYNSPALLRGQDPYTNPAPIPFDPARPLTWPIEDRREGSEAAVIRSRLVGALGIGDDDLTVTAHIVRSLTGQPAGSLVLDRPTLSWLYRLVRQAAWSRLTIDEYCRLLWLLFYPQEPDPLTPPAGSVPLAITAVRRIGAAAAWLRAAPFNIYQLQYVITGKPSAYFAAPFATADLRRLIATAASAAQPARLGPAGLITGDIRAGQADAIFKQLTELGLVTSIGIVTDRRPDYAELAGLLPLTHDSFVAPSIDADLSARAFRELATHEPPYIIAPDGAESGYLSADFTEKTPLAFLFPDDPDPASRTARQGEVREVLLGFRADIAAITNAIEQATVAQDDQAAQGVADFTGVTRDLLTALLRFSAGEDDLARQRVALLSPLPAADPVPQAVDELLTALARGALWANLLGFTAAQVTAAAADPRAFGLEDTATLDLDSIRTLEEFIRLTATLNDTDGVLFKYFARPIEDGVPLLAGLTGWDSEQIGKLIGVFWPAGGGREPMARTVAGTARLQAAFALADATGTDAFFLAGLRELLRRPVGVIGGVVDLAAWAAYEQAAGRTLDALSGRYGDGFAEVYAQVRGEIETAERDAMVGHTIWLLAATYPDIVTPKDLYQFLLIDVEMSDCAITTPIAQGIGSVQLYLQRCRMSLEPYVTELDVDPEWWSWLSTYRIWEANRKIFLYPENYIQPQLRSGQSPEFRRLVDSLLQADLSESSVGAAYNKYFDELDDLASLVPVASHNADLDQTPADDSPARLFLVARPKTDPYSYCWRTHDRAQSWSPWYKVDLSISAPEVTAVYAFARLFLFWTELDTGKTSTIEDAAAKARYLRTAALRYSFLTASGQWVQPQVLAATVPTEVEPDDYDLLTAPPVRQALTPSGLFWQQPYAFKLSRGLTGTGRVNITRDLFNVSGDGTTQFKREIRPGDRISVGGQIREVGIVVADHNLAVEDKWTRTATNAEFKVIPARSDETTFPPFEGAGRIDITARLTLVTGHGTAFAIEVRVGDRILVADEVRTVIIIEPDKPQLTVDEPWSVTRQQEPYVVIPARSGSERLVVMFGGNLPTTAAIDPKSPHEPDNQGRDPFLQQKEAFDFGVFYSARLAKNSLVGIAGQVALNYSALLDADLQVTPTRTLVANYSYSADDNPRPYGYRVDRSERLLQAAEGDNAVADNYWGNSAPGTPPSVKPSADHRTLLYNISATATLRNVGNQLGWAVFDNVDESFLVRSSEPGLDRLSAIVASHQVADEELGEALMLSASAYTDRPSEPFADLDFTFTRLTTSVLPRLRQRLLSGGLDRLLALDSQTLPELPFSRFYSTPTAGPPPHVNPPPDRLDFNGSYGLYFKEMFLFCPWLVADRLQNEQRFDDAKRWYEHVFNPTAKSSITDTHPHDRYWRYLPFRSLTLDSLLADLTNPAQITAYNDHPFDPDAIARLRPAAYPKAVVLDYIDNLLNWGDYLFGQDTSESINEATQLYVLASDLLGPRPTQVGVCPVPPRQNFRQIREKYGQDIPQFLIDLENGLPDLMNSPEAFWAVPINDIRAYFCVPENTELIAYWDKVDDRLFKIRNCMNLQGVVRPLPIFEPPINPNQLVRARATTGGGGSVVRAVPGPPPFYRFATMIERAKSFAASVTSLGIQLLSVLERQDAEHLALLRNSQEAALLDLTVQLKQQQLQQALSTGTALVASRDGAQARIDHYQKLIDSELSPEELANLEAMEAGLVFNILASVARTASSIAYTIPQIGSPFAITYGGIQVGSALAAGATVFEIGSVIAQYNAQKSLTMASYQRRTQDWDIQRTMADFDKKAAIAQLAGNAAAVRIAQRDLELTITSIAQNREMQSFLLKKFTSEQLYQWMAGRLSEVYFQSWLLALDLARSAERAFQFELNTSRTFLDSVYWDSAKKGLLAGEGLALALAQMDKEYTDGYARTLEIEKTISLAQLDPRALLDLKASGQCVFGLSERLFDFDFPGHYCRKLKTIAVTIPAIIGPYQTVHATLTQLSNATVLLPNIEAIRYLLGSTTTVPSPEVLRSNIWVSQQIALSRGLNDAGMFMLDFGDPRYLPFEGTGAVSTWRLSMPPPANRFDFTTISDVLVTISYTAKDGGGLLRKDVVAQPELKEYVGSPLLSLAQLYSQDWHAFITDRSDSVTQSLRFKVGRDTVPPHLSAPQLVGFFFQLVTDEPDGARAAAATPYVGFTVADGVEVRFAPNQKGSYAHRFIQPVDMTGVFDGHRTISFTLADTPAQYKQDGFLNPKVVRNIALVLYYQATVNWPSIG